MERLFNLKNMYRKLRPSKFIGTDKEQMVSEFHYVTGVEELKKPGFPNKERIELRFKLLFEEIDELMESIDDSDLIGVLDAFADIQYILSGTIAEFGMKDIFQKAFNEVHESNLSKIIIEEEEAIKEVKRYRDKLGIDCYYRNINGFYVIYRKFDNKILKPLSYKKPKLEKFL